MLELTNSAQSAYFAFGRVKTGMKAASSVHLGSDSVIAVSRAVVLHFQ